MGLVLNGALEENLGYALVTVHNIYILVATLLVTVRNGMGKRRTLGKGRKSIKIEILKGIEEADPEYIVMIEGMRADEWDEQMVIRIAKGFVPYLFEGEN